MFQFFKISELFSNCSRGEVLECIKSNSIDSLLKLLMVLDSFRCSVNLPLFITSSYRDEDHNKRVGGSLTSQHRLGQAIDFCTLKDFEFESFILLFRDFIKSSALNIYLGQIIFYHKRKFIHIGLRTKSHPTLTFIHYEKGDN